MAFPFVYTLGPHVLYSLLLSTIRISVQVPTPCFSHSIIYLTLLSLLENYYSQKLAHCYIYLLVFFCIPHKFWVSWKWGPSRLVYYPVFGHPELLTCSEFVIPLRHPIGTGCLVHGGRKPSSQVNQLMMVPFTHQSSLQGQTEARIYLQSYLCNASSYFLPSSLTSFLNK